MNQYKSSSQLKSLAKGQLLGKYPIVIGAFLLSQLMMFVLSSLSLLFVDTTTVVGSIIDFLITFIISLFGGVFSAGQAYIYLNISCGRACRATDVFYGFKQHQVLFHNLFPVVLQQIFHIFGLQRFQQSQS